MNNNDTIRKTLIVADSLCLVCSALISFSAVELRDLQQAMFLNDGIACHPHLKAVCNHHEQRYLF